MKIKDTEYAIASADNPLVYPGKIPDFSFLYQKEDFYKIDLILGRRVGQSHLIWSGDKPDGACRSRESLNNRLVRIGATSLEYRYPVITYGSNASPSQLEGKYFRQGISSVIPVIQGRLLGVDIVYSPHFTSYGSIPATVITCPGAEIEIHVTFINEMQLQILDQSEPNYNRVRMDSREFPLQLKTGEILSEYYIYISKKGYLKFDNQLYRLSAIKALNSKFHPATQIDILTKLIDYWNRENQEKKFDNVDTFVNLLKSEAVWKDRLNRWLSQRFRHSDQALTFDTDFSPKVYRQIKPIWPKKGKDEFIIEPNYQRSPGEFAIAINQKVAKSRGLGRHVRIEHTLHNHSFSVIAERLLKSQVDDPEIILMDQTLRNSLGVDIGDTVKIQKIKTSRSLRQLLLDSLIPRNYLMMRVQKADKLMIEKPNCTMTGIAMEILGIENGDIVIFESSIYDKKSGNYKIVDLPLRAYQVPESMKQLRESTQSGMFLKTRFPDCSEVFGVFPDLPWVFIDADARIELGIQMCSPVKVSISRRYQLIKEFRSFSLLIILSILGATSLFDVEPFSIGGIFQVPLSLCILFLIIVIALLLFINMRQRLSPKITSHKRKF